jgi:hypothetical protein
MLMDILRCRGIIVERMYAMAVGVWIGVLQVTEFRNNATMAQGKQVQNGWSQYAKTNDNLGQVNGNFDLVPVGVNILNNFNFIENFFPNSSGQSPVLGNNLEVM